jgi:hypothetical protein
MDPDPDPDPAIFVSDQQKRQQKIFLCFLLFEGTGTFTLFFKDKSHEEVTKQ